MFFKNKKKSFVVYTAGAAVLKEVAAPVVAVDDEIRQLASEMLDAMRVFNGIGLAAPQKLQVCAQFPSHRVYPVQLPTSVLFP